jgi:Tfp pilus assembly protein PilO
MNTVREYRMPLLIAGAAAVVAIILWVALIAPQNSKLSSLQDQSATLQTQEAALQGKLTALQSEGQKLSSNCTDLQKISTQIPSVQSPTDIDAEESSFESQFNALAGSSGVTLSQFSGFAPANTTGTAATGSSSSSASTGASTSTAGVTAVPTTITVQGNYGQITAFVNGLDSFPRLFVIQKFILGYGPASTAAAGSTSGATAAQAAGGTTGAGASTSGTPLWVGGTPTAASAGPYNLSITGSIYYTSTPNALSACSKATAAQSSVH